MRRNGSRDTAGRFLSTLACVPRILPSGGNGPSGARINSRAARPLSLRRVGGPL
jgi:hypothetical protein